jgi:DNA-binding transcriptional regulator YiaG
MSKVKAETCAVCGQGTARAVAHVLRKVLLGHVAEYSRREFVCDTCNDSYTDNEQGEANARAERLAIRRALAVVGPKEIRIARRLANATQAQMEEILGLGRNTLARWETGQRPVPKYIKATFRLIALNPLAADLLRSGAGHSQTTETEEGRPMAEVIDLAQFLKGSPPPSAYKQPATVSAPTSPQQAPERVMAS